MFYGEKKPQENLYPSLNHPANPSSQSQQRRDLQPDTTFQSRNNDPRASVFIKKEKEDEQPGWCAKCCACTQLSYYQEYFKVTNKDVLRRIMLNLKFWEGGFFKPVDQDYDLYGPFWLNTTLIFVLGAVHNILIYQSKTSQNFSYDFQAIGVAFSIFYILGFGFPALFSLLLKCSGIETKIAQIICLYGYSIPIYIICCMLCTINISLLSWGFLLYAGGTRIGFLLKNLLELQIPTSKKVLVTAVVLIEAGIHFLIIKFVFIKNGDLTNLSSALTHDYMIHLRNYQ